MLLDAYGELLTEKQSDSLRRYYEQDYSFGEIADEFDVSRQAIFDSVKNGESALENYEQVLGLVRSRTGLIWSPGSGEIRTRGSGAGRPAKRAVFSFREETAETPANPSRLADAAGRLRSLAEKIAGEGKRPEPAAIAEELGKIAAELESLPGHRQEETDRDADPNSRLHDPSEKERGGTQAQA